MADEIQAQTPESEGQRLPLFFKNLAPLNLKDHGDLCLTEKPDFSFAKTAHLVPVLAEEIAMAQRFYPIVFDANGIGQPIAIMGLKEGENTFVDDEGNWRENVYIPAYVRRYPFLLARLREDDDKLSLCIDPSGPMITKDSPRKFFEAGEITPMVSEILQFCERYERAALQTRSLCEKINELELLREGETTVQGGPKPVRFSGFRIIDEAKIRDLKQKQVHELTKNGSMGVLYAHMFSLPLFQNMVASQFAIGEAMGNA